jgi:serine/threonine-protein kinase
MANHPPDGPDGDAAPTRVPADSGKHGGAETVSARIQLDRSDAPSADSRLVVDRYHDEGMLGRGGMGEVRLCLDRGIGRRVALKMLSPGEGSRSGAHPRFVREARVQGRLEHPAVVPVYDLGTAADGRPYFTMKRIGGHTLEQVLTTSASDPTVAERWTQRRLLNAFAQVCEAVHYAHEQGVIHRDLKPSNIMLGDFGEVYVLDWGVAKLMGDDVEEDDRRVPATPAQALDRTLGGSESGERTGAGELLGTPGYMAPEQIDGGSVRIGGGADVYALGTILFEIVTGLPLHVRDNFNQVLASTIAGPDFDERVAESGRDVSPEIIEICRRATAVEIADRYADVREMLGPLERFLEGDRDLALRRQLAEGAAEQADDAAKRALDHGDAAARSTALAACSRALALDPENARARATLVRLLITPPDQTPAGVQDELVESERDTVRSSAKGSISAFASFLAFVPVVAWMGLRDGTSLGILVVLIVAGIVISILGSRAKKPEVWAAPAALAASTASLIVMSRVFGPFVLIPGLAMANAIGFSLESRGARRIAYVIGSSMAVVIPAALELMGTIPPSYAFESNSMTILPQLTDLPRTQSLVLLWTASLAAIILPAVLVSRTRDALRGAEHRLAVMAWQLRQLVPSDTRSSGIRLPTV